MLWAKIEPDSEENALINTYKMKDAMLIEAVQPKLIRNSILLSFVMAIVAMTRDSIPEHRRGSYFVYVDEFANFTTVTIAGMLSELRKYRVGLILAGQYLSAIETPIRDAIFGNVGNLCIFRCGAMDAPALSKQLGQIDQDSLINLPNYRMFTKIMVNGTQTKAFSARTISH